MKALKYFLLSTAIVLVALGSSASAWAEEVVQNISGDLILTGSYTVKDGGYFDRDEQGAITRVSMGNGFAEIAIRSLQDPKGVVKDMREFNLVPTVNGIEYPYMVQVNKDGSGANLYCPYTVYGTFNLKATYKKDPQKVYNFSFKIVQESMFGIRYFFHFEDENGEAIKIIPQYHYDRLKNLYMLTLPKGIAPQDKNSSFKGWIINNKIYQPGDVVAVPANNFNGAIVIVKPSISHKGSWKLYSNGRWAYYYNSNTYARDGFKLINNKTYHFDKSGWMSTGWVFDKGNWYLMAQSGEMLFGWQKVHGLWYYLDKQTGKMAAKTYIGKYFVNESGVWTNGTWIKSRGMWWYRYANGSYPANGFASVDNKTYHFDKSGWMSTGWVFNKGNWYLMAQSGEMLFGWQKVHGLWYYLDKQTGKMAANTSIDGYKLNHNGAWVA